MSAKTIFIIVISVLVTVILMNNTDEMDFWLLGDTRLPKLAVLAVTFVTGAVIGYLLGRPRKKPVVEEESAHKLQAHSAHSEDRDYLSDEDREYIS